MAMWQFAKEGMVYAHFVKQHSTVTMQKLSWQHLHHFWLMLTLTFMSHKVKHHLLLAETE